MIRKIIDTIQRLLGSNAGEPLNPLFRSIGIRPNNYEYYRLAFTHSSLGAVDVNGNKINNERLEFLGDSVLSTAISNYLYLNYPQWNEGQMSKRRSAIVKRAVNNALGRQMNLVQYLKHGHDQPEHLSADVYGNTLEALIGAIYLDLGYTQAESFIINRILPIFAQLEDSLIEQTTNYKSLLIEWAQKYHFSLDFRMLQEPKRAGGVFVAAVYIDEKKVGIGRGKSKKEAHQEAAHATLTSLNAIDSSISLSEYDT